MSAGSGASNLGYGNVTPNNVNSNYVNADSSQYAARFGSNEIPGTPPGPLPGLAGAKSNVDAAAGYVPGISLFSGGSKHFKRKIKNITKQYKRMKTGSRKMKNIKRKLRSRAVSRRMARAFAGGRRSRRYRKHSLKGGYSQYQNNMPLTRVFEASGINLPHNLSMLATPVQTTPLSNCVNCLDNYNHFLGKGFPSKGH